MKRILHSEQLPDLIRDCLATRAGTTKEAFPDGFFQTPPLPAAVLLPLVRKGDDWHLLFIRRAENEKDRHSGQVAFPGGRVERCDPSDEAAALREANEEIGLSPEQVTLLGRLGAYRTVSNFRVTPVVAQVQGSFEPTPDPTEVERVFSIPLAWLADPANLERRPRRLPDSDTEIDVLYYRLYDGELLWGITARLVESFISRIAAKIPS